MTPEIKFIIDTIFSKTEGQNIEFKEVNSKNPVNTILAYTEKYVTGFLNAAVEGDIYLGIQDSGKISGIIINRSDKDEILRTIPNKLRNTKPSVIQSCYQVNFYTVYDTESMEIENLYVVRIHVFKLEFEEEYFYKTSGGNTYLKKEASCMELPPEELAKELKNRHQKSLKRELEKINIQLDREPENKTLLRKKAEIYRFMGNVDMMNEIYEKLIDLNPKNSTTRVAYASAHKSIGDLDGALSILNDALKLDKNNSAVLKLKGSILLSSNNIEEALQSYHEALNNNPDDYTVITQIGIILRELCKYKESIYFFNYALSKYPGYRAAKYERQKTYYKMFLKRTKSNINQ
ncbi:ATP-binding protein [Anabaena subtropica]|uniref:DNA binding domain-containing protein n=1 Tax=Anabaena subtropica FACHB-260 TaxID=2692884 RepID=A0ABR8CRS4_9NOST|nr:ATP-binding protein [Anabaena subtropica]MBD2345063.1 putative DNA binding domain-containing protein [Anabaena subtropica FACHB-260]